MHTHPTMFLRPLLAAGALLALGACAETGAPQREMASISPLELVGLTVQSSDGTRMLGTVDDVVLAPDQRPVQVIVASGAPMYPTERRIAVNTDQVRYSHERQALVLTEMTPEQFAALPDTVRGDRMTSIGPVGGGIGGSVGAAGSTNWTGVTIPR